MLMDAMTSAAIGSSAIYRASHVGTVSPGNVTVQELRSGGGGITRFLERCEVHAIDRGERASLSSGNWSAVLADTLSRMALLATATTATAIRAARLNVASIRISFR